MFHVIRRSSALLVVGTISLASVGCATTPTPAGTSVAHSFQAPFDPKMGEVVVSVTQVDLAAASGACPRDLGQAVRAQLISSLGASRNIVVADRSVMSEIAAEQRLNQSGATSATNRPEMGKLAPPRYLIKATITDFKEAAQGASKGGRVELGPLIGIAGAFTGGLGGQVLRAASSVNPTFGQASQTIEGVVGLQIRIVDIESGTVIGQTHSMGRLTRQNSKTVMGIAGLSATDARFTSSVLGEATRAAAEEATVEIHTILNGRAQLAAVEHAVPLLASKD